MTPSRQENPFAGHGPVLLDIGDDIGALIVTMPAELEGIEVEIRPVSHGYHEGERHHHDAGQLHHHRHEATDGAHDHDHDHVPGDVHLPHVAVVPRPAGGIQVHSLVFPELVEGRYELYQRPHGAVELRVQVSGGQVTQAVWPVG